MDSWDKYFYGLCASIAYRSKCLSRQIGCVIVKDNYVVSTGYNGPPSGCLHCDDINYRKLIFKFFNSEDYLNTSVCPRKSLGFESGKGMMYCQASHAERNAISAAARLGHSTNLCTLYLNSILPCLECSKSIINSGIRAVVCADIVDYDSEGITGRYLLEQSGVLIRKFNLC